MLVSKLKFLYCPGMVFRSSEDINYFSLSAHERRRRTSRLAARVMSRRVPHEMTGGSGILQGMPPGFNKQPRCEGTRVLVY